MPSLSERQIEQLAREAGLSSRDIADVVDAYNLAVEIENADSWNNTQVRNWLAQQVSTRGGDTAVVLGQDEPGHSAPRQPPPSSLAAAAGRFYAEDDATKLQRAAAAADEAASRARRTRDRFYGAADMFFDSGPAFDPDAMATSLAVGVFTDAAGNPIIDPETGAPTEVTPQSLWQAIKGQTFDMGTLSMPRAGRRERPRVAGEDARLARLEAISSERRRFMTPSMTLALLGSMGEDDITRIQQQLWEAGLFGEAPPSWGTADEATRKAYMALFAEASLTPNEPIDRVLNRLMDEAVSRGLVGGAESAAEQVPAFKPEVASEESLGQMIDDIAGDLLGRFATPEEKSSLVAKLREREIANQRAQYDRDVEEMTSGGGAGGGAPGGIDAFMAAISTQESGGDYSARNAGTGAYGKFQILPSNWAPWAERAGLGRNAPRTPDNQERVARHVMLEYYQRFGNWRDVAIAWFAGPGAVGKPGAENRTDGNMSVRDYADRAVQRMADAGAGEGVGSAAGRSFDAIETWDPAAEAEAALKAADPLGWQGHQFGERAVEFFQLLGGVG